ncbi:NERD domain-containing protein [Bacillus sp. H-16]|nr:NERD domain-containing protein [Alteribacter salitolerans]
MILKHRKQSVWLLKLTALKRRLPHFHKQLAKVSEDHSLKKSGYRGEKALDYQLDYIINESDCVVLQDLRLTGQLERHFQVDTLFITPNS